MHIGLRSKILSNKTKVLLRVQSPTKRVHATARKLSTNHQPFKTSTKKLFSSTYLFIYLFIFLFIGLPWNYLTQLFNGSISERWQSSNILPTGDSESCNKLEQLLPTW